VFEFFLFGVHNGTPQMADKNGKPRFSFLGQGQPERGIAIAMIVITLVVIVYYVSAVIRNKDRFVSQRAQEVYSKSQGIFDRTRGKATFSEYKTVVPNSEVVLYTDTKTLWKDGRLTPENVQAVI
jgi:hypothetical protein